MPLYEFDNKSFIKKMILKKNIFGLLALCTLLVSCTESKKQFSNVQQRDFDYFLSSKRSESYNYSNDIQRKEFYKGFKKSLFNYVDSIGLFVLGRYYR